MSYTMVVLAATAVLLASVIVGIILSYLVDAKQSMKRQHSPNCIQVRKFACSDYDIDELTPICVNFDL